MKHIKSYGYSKPVNYGVGDYVVMKVNINDKIGEDRTILEIYDIESSAINMIFLTDHLNKIHTGWYIIQDILRKATTEEIENLKIKIQANKYNL